MSVDGCIDDTSPNRLLLSNAEDFDRIDAVRAASDAILIGASTIRRDNPRLLVNSEARRADRAARGPPEHPIKVTITASGDLNRELKFWHHGGDKVIYCPDDAISKLSQQLGNLADIVGTGEQIDLKRVLEDLGKRGVAQLMVEGGTTIHTQFLTAGLVDEIHLAVTPFFVGESQAPHFMGEGSFPNGLNHRMTLVEVKAIGDVALLRYLTKASR